MPAGHVTVARGGRGVAAVANGGAASAEPSQKAW